MDERSGRLVRDVVWDARFENELADLSLKILRLEDAVDGLEWVLAREPERGTQVAGTDIYAWPVQTYFSQALVYYRFDDRQVSLLSIRESEADEHAEDLVS